MWLFSLFVVVPLIEIALFIKIGGWLTLWPTLAIVVGSAMLGTALIRREGARAMNDLRQAVQQMRDPSRPLAEGAAILFAGALLIAPGFLTDTIGLLLLIPQVRRAIIARIGRGARVQTHIYGGPTPDRPRYYDGDVIEGDFTEAEPTKQPTHKPSGWTRH